MDTNINLNEALEANSLHTAWPVDFCVHDYMQKNLSAKSQIDLAEVRRNKKLEDQ